MAEVDDARRLMSELRHPMEELYADHANSMKAMANRARKEIAATGDIPYSSSAKAVYQQEYNSLMTKLNDAEKNAPLERAAHRIANAQFKTQMERNPDLTKKEQKKRKDQALRAARIDVGSVSRTDRNINITDRAWEAIQAGAISPTTLRRILNNTDTTKLRERATPKTTTKLSTAQINKIRHMSNNSKYTIEQIASSLGVSTSTVAKYMKGED